MSSHTPKKNSSSLLTNTYSVEEKLKPLQVPIDDDKEYIEAIKEASFGVQQSVFVNCFVQCCFQIIP